MLQGILQWDLKTADRKKINYTAHVVRENKANRHKVRLCVRQDKVDLTSHVKG